MSRQIPLSPRLLTTPHPGGTVAASRETAKKDWLIMVTNARVLSVLVHLLTACGSHSGSDDTAAPATAASNRKPGWSQEVVDASTLNCVSAAVAKNSKVTYTAAGIACACLMDVASNRWSYADYAVNEIDRDNTLVADGTVKACVTKAGS